VTVRSTTRSVVGKVRRRAARRIAATLDPQAPVIRGSRDRLVASPVFLLSSVRSGSTLLRVVLNSHSQIRAPHEMHLRGLHVTIDQRKSVIAAMEEAKLDARELEYLLWDRIMHRELVRSGKSIFVDKTPQNVQIYKRLRRGWPQARYIFLLRHPASITDSLNRAKARPDYEVAKNRVLTLASSLDEARAALKGHTVRYEDLTADPAGVTRGICDFLGVRWEPGMLDYGSQDHGTFRPGIGDWSPNIKTGTIVAARPLPAPDELPADLLAQARAWGYVD
jgi:hypothetical protein